MLITELLEKLNKLNKLNKELGVSIIYGIKIDIQFFNCFDKLITTKSEFKKILENNTYFNIDECEVELLESAYDIIDLEYIGYLKGKNPQGEELKEEISVYINKVDL